MRDSFAECVLDTQLYVLHRAGTAIRLRPKAFRVLQYLLEHGDRVISKDEFCAHMWPGQFINDAALEGCIKLARQAIGDSGREQRLIQSRRGYGYRFVGVVEEEGEATQPETTVDPPPRRAGPLPQPVGLPLLPPTLVVGRETEFAHLHDWLAQAWGGQRQMVFISGEAGIGKTTVVDAFVASITTMQGVRIAYGQCVEHYGAGEAYQPVFEALGRWRRAPGGEPLRALLRQHAPTWLAQMPGLLSAADAEVVQRLLTGTTQPRMLRELAEALEIMTADTPLVLVLEDLHWSDYATLDLLAVLARRREAARLLVLGTYRPTDVLVQGHPLTTVVQELRLHGHCIELPLGLLSEATGAFPARPGQ